MPERKELDTPATAILLVSGIVFMAASAPFLPQLYCKSPSHNPDLCEGSSSSSAIVYDVTWSQAALGEQAATVDAAPGQGTATLHNGGAPPASLHLSVKSGDCTDTYNPSLTQNPATMTWTLEFKGNGSAIPDDKKTGTFTCSAGLDVTVARGETPKAGTVSASNTTAAQAAAMEGLAGAKENGDYVLTVSATRPASTVPTLPTGPGGTSLSVKVTVHLDGYAASVNRQTPEVGK